MSCLGWDISSFWLEYELLDNYISCMFQNWWWGEKKLFAQWLSSVQLFETPHTVACQASLYVGFPRQYWSGLPFPPPGDLPNSGIKLRSPTLQADSLLSEPPGKSSIPNKVSKLRFLLGCQLHADPIELSRHYVQGGDTSGQIRPTLSRKGPALGLVCIRIPGAGF